MNGKIRGALGLCMYFRDIISFRLTKKGKLYILERNKKTGHTIETIVDISTIDLIQFIK